VPDFSWGGPTYGIEPYSLKKMFETAQKVYERRENRPFDQIERDILTHIFELTETHRRFLK